MPETALLSRQDVLAQLTRFSPGIPAGLITAIHNLPEVRPVVVIDVSGGIANTVAATHTVEVTTIDYDVDSVDSTVVDEDGDPLWLYDEVAKVDPDLVVRILNYPPSPDGDGDVD